MSEQTDEWMMLGDDLLLTDAGEIATDPSCCCGVECDCGIEGCIGAQRNGHFEPAPPWYPPGTISNAEIRPPFLPPEGDPCYGGSRHGNPICARLDIYECATHDGERMILNPAGRTVVMTNPWTSTYSAYSGPFCSQRKCSAVHLGPVGDLLNDRPFWWADCGIGGWRIVNPWWTFTDAERATLFAKVSTAIGAGAMPAAGEFFTLILYLQFRRRQSECVEHSGIRMIAAHLTCSEDLPQPCPSDCTACPGLVATITGLTGVPCDTANGTIALTRTGCGWLGMSGSCFDLQITCNPANQEWEMLGAWRAACSGGGAIVSMGKNTTGCPPTGTWELTFNATPVCLGQKATVTIAHA